MIVELILGTLAGGLAVGFFTQAFRKDPNAPKPLPAPGGQPHDRAEAVRRVLKHLQRKTIAELTEGSAAVIEGTARARSSVAPLVSPYANEPCLGYHLDIRAARFDDEFRFAQLHEEARCTDFELEDDTGIIHVAGAGLELAITDGPFTYWDRPQPSIQPRIPYHYGPISIEEGRLVTGDKVLVCGVVTSALSATDYRDGKPVYTLRATPSFPLVASTDRDLFLPGDRPIAPEELHRRRP